MSSQMLNEQTFSQANIPASRTAVAERTMSLPGTIAKAIALLLVALAFGAVGWSVGDDWFSTSSGIWWLIGYFILIGLTVAAASNPDLALPVGFLYAVLMGFWMGAVSRVYEEQYDGIVAQALLASVSAFVACLILYLVRAVRVTPRLTRMIITATFAIFILYLAGWIFSIFGVDLLFWNEPNATGIILSIAICLVAAFNLFLDFSFIEQGVDRGAPAVMEWYAAFGLLATLVWLYAEILRLIALLRRS